MTALRRCTRGAAALSTIAIALALGASSTARPGQAADADATAARVAGLIPAEGASGGEASAANVSYHGGPVEHAAALYAISMLPPGAAFDASYRSVVDQYLGDVAAAAGETDNVDSVATQYADADGPIGFGSTAGGSWVDTQTPIPDDCSAAYAGSPITPAGCLSFADLRAEVLRAIAANGWPSGLGAVYLVFTPRNVGSCFGATPDTCAYDGFCAYHAYFRDGQSNPVVFAFVPYPDASAIDGTSCGPGAGPNGAGFGDAAANLVSHESIEAITDPLLTAWYDSSGPDLGEIADKCMTFGTTAGSGAARYNQVLDGHPYLLQEEWSNVSGSCAQGFAPAAPRPAIAGFAPAAAAAGATVTVTGSHFAGATDVRLAGAVGATFAVVSDSQLTVTMPAGAEAGPFVVSGPGGSAVSATSLAPAPSISGFAPAAAPPGATVTISGDGFLGVSSVRFDGLAATFAATSADTILATVPAGATSGPITVSGPFGTATSATPFAVDPLALGGAGNTVAYTLGAPAVAVAPGLTVSAPASATLASASVSVSAGLAAGDTLAATTTGTNVAASYAAGTLSLTGADTLAHYQAVLRSVTFASTGGPAGSRTIAWSASDGARTSPPVTSTVQCVAVLATAAGAEPAPAPSAAAAPSGGGGSAPIDLAAASPAPFAPPVAAIPARTTSAAATLAVSAPKTISLAARKPTLKLTVRVSKPTSLAVTLLDARRRRLAGWTRHAAAGGNAYAFVLPANARRRGRDTIRVAAPGIAPRTLTVAFA